MHTNQPPLRVNETKRRRLVTRRMSGYWIPNLGWANASSNTGDSPHSGWSGGGGVTRRAENGAPSPEAMSAEVSGYFESVLRSVEPYTVHSAHYCM